MQGRRLHTRAQKDWRVEDNWFMNEPAEINYFEYGAPVFSNTETTLLGRYFMSDEKNNAAIKQWLTKEFSKDYDPDRIHDELVNKLMYDATKQVGALKEPLASLVNESLANVNWDELASGYTLPMFGDPKAVDYAPGQAPASKAPGQGNIEQAIKLIDEALPTEDVITTSEELPLARDEDVQSIEEKPKRKRAPKQSAPRNEWEPNTTNTWNY